MSESVFCVLKSSEMGEVHSVYKNTINFIIGEKLIAIHPRSTIKTPMSIRITETEFELEYLDISAGDKVLIFKDKFVINEHEFDFSFTKTWNPKIDYIEINISNIDIDKIRFILDIMDLHGSDNSLKDIVKYIINNEPTVFLIEERDYFTKKTFSIITEWFKSISDKVSIDSSTNLAKLIGLGQGLTPSGDDFLSGLLSIFTLAGTKFQLSLDISESIKLVIKDNLHTTTFLSKEFLYYAIKNEYSEVFHELYNNLREENQDKIRATVIKFIQIGSTSGMDTLAGIVLGIYMVNELFKDLVSKGASYD